MEKVIAYYRDLLLSPRVLDSFEDYALSLLAILPVWLVLLWIVALVIRMVTTDTRARLGVATALRLIWAWSALVLTWVILGDVLVLWFLDRLPDWTSVTPHATYCFVGALTALIYYIKLHGELRTVQRMLFAAMPKANVASAR